MERGWQDGDEGDEGEYDAGPQTPSDHAYHHEQEDGWREPAAHLRGSFRSTRGNDNFKGDCLKLI